ncbi:hypothetical protein AA0498_2412 [Acidomonas methanolica]|nr:hypothetical protein EDC31_14411 [Acidomonas methanolica]GBQ56672.1 hypothetical protein AA0498_2412 [Acidomonas methanolica]
MFLHYSLSPVSSISRVSGSGPGSTFGALRFGRIRPMHERVHLIPPIHVMRSIIPRPAPDRTLFLLRPAG